MKVGRDIIPIKLTYTYIVKLEYKGSKYKINYKEIFNSYELDHIIRLNLVESLNENKNIIKYNLFKLR